MPRGIPKRKEKAPISREFRPIARQVPPPPLKEPNRQLDDVVDNALDLRNGLSGIHDRLVAIRNRLYGPPIDTKEGVTGTSPSPSSVVIGVKMTLNECHDLCREAHAILSQLEEI